MGKIGQFFFKGSILSTVDFGACTNISKEATGIDRIWNTPGFYHPVPITYLVDTSRPGADSHDSATQMSYSVLCVCVCVCVFFFN